jgi:hypothetical protein
LGGDFLVSRIVQTKLHHVYEDALWSSNKQRAFALVISSLRLFFDGLLFCIGLLRRLRLLHAAA